ncbi:MAG: MBL fold metallo-hydrolase [bacterium]|nr:MBL fold metallo-hydrolase [bacterium]MCP5068734.1 MBL fold metallo-hydrolase [bacterium]
MKLEEIGNQIYTCLQEEPGIGYSNSGLIGRGGGVVIDTFWDLAHTRELLAQYARVTPKPAGRVVNTHHNGDHCWGNQLFPEAEIIGHRLCAENFGAETPGLLEMIKSADLSEQPALATFAKSLAAWDFAGVELVPPTTLFDDRMTLDLEGTQVELVHVGPAHTESDVIVHLPEERVLFAGDVVFRLCTPVGWIGSFAQWIDALDQILALDPEVVVPGHGPLCGAEGPREMKAYLRHVLAESEHFFERGLTALEAAGRIDLGPFEKWHEPERLVFNVERAYREFRGDPVDTPIDPIPMIADLHALRSERWPDR